MKKILFAVPFVMAMLIGGYSSTIEVSANQTALPIETGDKLKPPENTECHQVDYNSSANAKRALSPANANGAMEIYDMCIGTYPKFASTSVEEGMDAVYYAKYYFFPEPMPYYQNLSYDGATTAGTTVRGLEQTMDLNTAYEKKDEPSHNDIFIFYPYDKAHATNGDAPNPNITGPYQIAYNSFYHNTYRARYFASEVNFSFELLESKENSTHTSKYENKTYTDKTMLFEGEIYYKIDENACFEDVYLDYKDECRNIEFYFPKGTVIDKSATVPTGQTNGEVINDVDTTSTPSPVGKNVVPEDRIAYRNPGEHVLVFYAEENMQLRVQKDLGTEYQTIGNQSDAQNVKPIRNEIAYFTRVDVDIDGSNITPITTISKVYNENYRKTGTNYEMTMHNGKPTINSNYKITSADGSHYKYDWQQDYLNYCTKDTDIWGEVNTENREDNTGSDTDSFAGMGQRDKVCYHDEGKEHHFWQYSWGQTGWYAADPLAN